MKKLSYIFIFAILFISSASAGNYVTPGIGVKWNLDDLVTNSGGSVTFSAGQYNVIDTVKISATDTLMITSDAIVKFAKNTYLAVRGTLIINPPTGVLFTAQNTVDGYYGMRIDTSSSTFLRKLTFEYAVSMRISDSNPTLDSCIIQYNNNNASTTFGNGAIAVFRANPYITNCKFLNNNRAAIQGGANIANAPKIIGCYFFGNDKTHQNVPQINLGTSGTDTTKILNNQILRGDTNSGGIGFLPIGNVYTVITGNIIKNNRYGITFNGSTNINAVVSYNTIDSNNTQGSPTLGGSGISFTGGSASAIGQNTIVTGNLIRWNLWGITIQGRSKPKLGNITNADTSDDGKNSIYGNYNNSATPRIDLYNNSVDEIYAQNNYWGFDNLDSIEAHIYHYTDNIALGPVIYTGKFTELNALIDGFYNGTTMIPDTVRLELHNASSPYALVSSSKGFLDANGHGSFTFSGGASGIPYYLVVKHRNVVETWSGSPVINSTYDFTSAQAQAFGNNMKLKGSKWCIYNGDVNQDGIVDSGDLGVVDNDNANYVSGYPITDLNGDGIVDSGDIGIVDNNNAAYVGRIIPSGASNTPKVMRHAK
jgi:hypothetical protein